MQTIIEPIDNANIRKCLFSWYHLCIEAMQGIEWVEWIDTLHQVDQPDPDISEDEEWLEEWLEEVKNYTNLQHYEAFLGDDLRYFTFYKLENGYKVDVWFDFFGITFFFDEEGLLHSDNDYAIRNFGVEHDERVYVHHGKCRTDILPVQDWFNKK